MQVSIKYISGNRFGEIFPNNFLLQKLSGKHHKSVMLVICTGEMCMALHYTILHNNTKYENENCSVINNIFTDCT